jgi:tetraprenyl-beta-curcumene synthase
MAGMETTRSSKTLELATLLTTGASYWLHINPLAKREIAHWRRRARTIPNNTLRSQALHKLTGERLNPEAAALFAILAAPIHRKRLIRLIVSFQIAYDYLDAINEAQNTANLQNGLTLHQALNDAVAIEPSQGDYYRHHPRKDDGGYLAELVSVCRAEIAETTLCPPLRQTISSAIERVGVAQTRNHALLIEGEPQLSEWAAASSDRAGYYWWELAAGGISSLGIHALFAAAINGASIEEARNIDAAYFPPVCAISALLDSLVDYNGDTQTTNHSFVSHYPSVAIAARRFREIANEGHTLQRPLRYHRRHAVLLAGIASFYLSANEARSPFAYPVLLSTLAELGPITTPMLQVMRLMRRHAGVSSTQQQAPKAAHIQGPTGLDN